MSRLLVMNDANRMPPVVLQKPIFNADFIELPQCASRFEHLGTCVTLNICRQSIGLK